MKNSWAFASNDEATVEAFRRAAQKEARRNKLAFPHADGVVLTKYDHLYWDITDALAAYRQDLHGYLFPEYEWAHDHIC